MMTLFLSGHPRMLQIYPCCNSCPEFVELNVLFESLIVLVHHLDTF